MCDIIRSICVEVFRVFPDRLETQTMCYEAVKLDPFFFYKVPDKFLTVEICQNAVKDGYWHIKDVPDQLKTVEMCNGAVKNEASFLRCVLDCFKTQGCVMRECAKNHTCWGMFLIISGHGRCVKKAVEKNPWSLFDVPVGL